MSEYLILASELSGATSAEQRDVLEARAAFAAQLTATGAMLDGERLRSSTDARRVRSEGGAVRIEQGPFESALASYWTVEAKDLDAAVALAKRVPTLPGETLEVRPVMKGEHDAAKTNTPGKVFAFGVLGSAPNEEAWVKLMNRIDRDTSDAFPGSFLAGVRLEAPRTGRRLVNQHGKLVVHDGPFLESKEVIGGLFFMRLGSLEEALAWVATTAFVRLGTAEVREVWRS